MNKAASTTLLLNADVFTRCKPSQPAGIFLHGDSHEDIRLTAAVCEQIASASLQNIAGDKTDADLFAFRKRFLCIQKSVVSGDEDSGSAHGIDDQAHQIFQFLHGIITSFKNLIFRIRLIPYRINDIVINVHHFCTAHKFPPLCLFHRNQCFICHRTVFRIFSL